MHASNAGQRLMGMLDAPDWKYRPRIPDGLVFDRIVLARGSTTTPDRLARARSICAAFPSAAV